mgnify:CR=1 FL=1
MTTTPQAWPDWYDGRHINEVLFCQQFLDKHPMKCVRGRLFTVDGLIEAASGLVREERNVLHGRQLYRRQELLQQPIDRLL